LADLLFFIAAFLYPEHFNSILSSISVIYASLLGLYVGSKEITRWHNKDFISRHSGEIYIALWTLVMLIIIALAMFNNQYEIQSEFVATYITIMGIFAISQKSKAMKKRRDS
jgi:hypothetical protein